MGRWPATCRPAYLTYRAVPADSLHHSPPGPYLPRRGGPQLSDVNESDAAFGDPLTRPSADGHPLPQGGEGGHLWKNSDLLYISPLPFGGRAQGLSGPQPLIPDSSRVLLGGGQGVVAARAL
jgi:hypothetical protein